jgi:hypothetical protein
LERFANCGDSPENYQALSKAFPSFWPVSLKDGGGRDLSWVPEAHRVFLFFRDLLRRFWTRNPLTLKDGIAASLLFGTMHDSELKSILSGQFANEALDRALAPLRNSLPGKRISGNLGARFWVDWSARTVDYISYVDFQRAVWLLFCESWRARVCPLCKLYFVAEKPSQKFCSTTCSNRSRLASNLNWWNKHGEAWRKKQAHKSTRRKR